MSPYFYFRLLELLYFAKSQTWDSLWVENAIQVNLIFFYPYYLRMHNYNSLRSREERFWSSKSMRVAIFKVEIFHINKMGIQKSRREGEENRYGSEEREATGVKWTKWKNYSLRIASLSCTVNQTGRQTDRQVHDDIALDRIKLDCIGWNFVR